MALAYSEFGHSDVSLYASYLLTHYVGSGGRFGMATQSGVSAAGSADGVEAACACRKVCATPVAYLESFVRERGGSLRAWPELDYARGEGSDEDGNARVCEDNGGGDATAGAGAGESQPVCGDTGAPTVVGGSGAVDFDVGSAPGEVRSGRTLRGGDVAGAGARGGLADAVTGQAESAVGAGGVVGSGVAETVKGKNYARNKAKREKYKLERRELANSRVPVWRRTAKPLPSLSGSAVTVNTETAEMIEAKRTRALRYAKENEVAVAVAEHRLQSLRSKEKTEALLRLQVARIEEQVNTTRAKSQASYKKCGSPIESVGSAMSAGEFGWKQEIRKREALQTKLEYIEAQNMELCKYASAEGLRIVSQMPEPYIPTDEEIEAEDEDISPYPSMDEMRAHAAAMCGDDYPW